MKIFIICSKVFYHRIPPIQKVLEEQKHLLTFPNRYPDTTTEDEYRKLGTKQHSKWKASMLKHSAKVIEKVDAVLVLNFKKKDILNYIGGATFLEMYDAFRMNKKIFLYNSIPVGMLKDEINGMHPIIIKRDLSKVK